MNAAKCSPDARTLLDEGYAAIEVIAAENEMIE
jgi:hypothetical protein